MISVFYCDSKAFSALISDEILIDDCFEANVSCWRHPGPLGFSSGNGVSSTSGRNEQIKRVFYCIFTASFSGLLTGFQKKPAFPPQDKASWIRSRRFGVATTFETPQFWILQSPCVIRSLVISWSWCCWLPRRRLRWINSRFFVGHVLSAPPNQKKDAPQMGVDLLTKWLGPVNPKQTLHWSPSGVFIPAVFLWSWGKKSNKKEVLFVGILMFCIMPLGTGNWDLFFWRGLWKRSHPWKPNMTLENTP